MLEVIPSDKLFHLTYPLSESNSKGEMDSSGIQGGVMNIRMDEQLVWRYTKGEGSSIINKFLV